MMLQFKVGPLTPEDTTIMIKFLFNEPTVFILEEKWKGSSTFWTQIQFVRGAVWICVDCVKSQRSLDAETCLSFFLRFKLIVTYDSDIIVLAKPFTFHELLARTTALNRYCHKSYNICIFICVFHIFCT